MWEVTLQVGVAKWQSSLSLFPSCECEIVCSLHVKCEIVFPSCECEIVCSLHVKCEIVFPSCECEIVFPSCECEIVPFM